MSGNTFFFRGSEKYSVSIEANYGGIGIINYKFT